jgi:hypothetical protein
MKKITCVAAVVVVVVAGQMDAKEGLVWVVVVVVAVHVCAH